MKKFHKKKFIIILMNNESWVEKFRPKKLSSIISQEEVILSLQNVIKTKNIPHLLFFGPSGCGKTSTILALAKELFGNELWEDRIIELNASDERGIKTVREKIKTYAKSSIKHQTDSPPWKIIILDEADNMTSDSQFALRKIMEDYSSITRFCILCNYHHKIINPIISRCSLFRFRPIPKDQIKNKLFEICKYENIFCSDKNINKIINICTGDLRKAVNLLQKCKNNKSYFLSKDLKNKDKINSDIIYEISGIAPLEYLNNFIEYSIKCNEKEIKKVIDLLFYQSYSLINQLNFLTDIILKNNIINDKQKSKIIKIITDIDQHLIKGCDEYIQYFRLSYFIMKIMNEKNEN